jgi:hypothetical protein
MPSFNVDSSVLEVEDFANLRLPVDDSLVNEPPAQNEGPTSRTRLEMWRTSRKSVCQKRLPPTEKAQRSGVPDGNAMARVEKLHN